MKKLINLLYKIVILIFIAIFSWVFYLNIDRIIKAKTIIPIIIVFFLLIIFNVFTKIKKVVINPFIKKVALLLFSIFIFVVAFATRINPNWDYKDVLFSAYDVANGGVGNILYLGRYPNNLLLHVTQTIIAQISLFFCENISLKTFETIIIVINCLVVITSIFLMNYTIKKIINKEAAIITNILSVIYCPIYLYSSIMYTDTLALLFTSISLFLYYIHTKANTKKYKNLSLILLIIAIILGYKFRATNLFILIAIIIEKMSEIDFKFIIKTILITIITFTSINTLISNNYKMSKETYDQLQFPYTHWIMMALNPNTIGGYLEEDAILTHNAGSIAARKELNIKEIKKRINNYKPEELLERLFITKTKRAWASPTLETSYYLTNDIKNLNFISKIVTYRSLKYLNYLNYIRGVYIFILLGVVISGFYSFNSKQKYIFISQLCLIGLFIFELIWECNARHIYSFLPFMFITSSYGYTCLFNTVKKKTNRS